MHSTIIPAPASIIAFVLCVFAWLTFCIVGNVLDVLEDIHISFTIMSSCCILLFYLFFCRRFFTRLIKAANVTEEDTISYYSVSQNIHEHLSQWITGIAMGVSAVLMLRTNNVTHDMLGGLMSLDTVCFFASYFVMLWREQRVDSETEKLNRVKSNRTLLLLILAFTELILLTLSAVL